MIYSTGSFVFEPNLPVIDVLMWNDSEEIKKYLDTFKDKNNDE